MNLIRNIHVLILFRRRRRGRGRRRRRGKGEKKNKTGEENGKNGNRHNPDSILRMSHRNGDDCVLEMPSDVVYKIEMGMIRKESGIQGVFIQRQDGLYECLGLRACP